MKTKAVERSYMWLCAGPRRQLYPPCPLSSLPDQTRFHSILLWGQWSPGLKDTHHSGVKVPVPVTWGFFMLLCKSRSTFLRKCIPNVITNVATLMLDLQWWPSPQFSQVPGWGWTWGNFMAIASQTTPLPVFIPSFSWAKTDSVQNDFC